MTVKNKSNAMPGAASKVADPFAWFSAQCEAKRVTADHLDYLANALDYDSDTTTAVALWLRQELLPAIEDEAHDLFPLLRLRAHKKDDFEGALSNLTFAHVHQQTLARRVLPKLEALALISHPATMDRPLTEAMVDLGSSLRQHAAVLSAIIMPIARLRLKAQDLVMLGRSIASRRAD
jgi:hypothetical protein